jgi:hypothetical protein
MKKALQKIFSLFTKNNPPPKKAVRKTRGQSLVEVALAFPVLIMLFSGMIEFGFILNFYLSLLDATRDSARLYSGGDPFLANGTTDNDADFYYQAAVLVRRTLDPSYVPPTNLVAEHFLTDYRGRRIVLDPAADDVIVTVYGANDSGVILWRDAGPYHLFPNGRYQSIFTTSTITSTRVTGAPNAGILVVEVHYNYHHVLSLPWLTAFLPNPLHLQAYTIMPIRAGEPVTTP